MTFTGEVGGEFPGLRHTAHHISHPTFHEVDREKVLLDGQVRELELELVLGRAVRRDRQTADERAHRESTQHTASRGRT